MLGVGRIPSLERKHTRQLERQASSGRGPVTCREALLIPNDEEIAQRCVDDIKANV